MDSKKDGIDNPNLDLSSEQNVHVVPNNSVTLKTHNSRFLERQRRIASMKHVGLPGEIGPRPGKRWSSLYNRPQPGSLKRQSSVNNMALRVTLHAVINNDNSSVADTASICADEPPCLSSYGSARKALIFGGILFQIFTSAVVIHLLGPLYPSVAESKGLKMSEYGLVFGIMYTTMAAFSIVYGKYMNAIGPKRLVIAGSFIIGTCGIAFGFLDKVEDKMTFYVLSLAIRLIYGTGESAIWTSGYLFGARLYPDNVATAYAMCESIFGIGTILGPILGGAMFEMGGFTLAFVISASPLVVVAFILFLTIPTVPKEPKVLTRSRRKRGLLDIFKIPAAVISIFTVLVSSFGTGFYIAMLDHSLEHYGLTKFEVGLMISISGITYAICCPVFGIVCDKYLIQKIVMFLTGIVGIAAFSVLGPIPILQLEQNLYLIGLGLALGGITMAGELVAGCIDTVEIILEHGFPDSVETYSVTSGLFIALYALGSFSGPTIGGILNDHIGFGNTCFVIVFLHVAVVVLIGLRAIIWPAKGHHKAAASLENGNTVGENGYKGKNLKDCDLNNKINELSKRPSTTTAVIIENGHF